MEQTARKTVVAKILTDRLTNKKLEAIEREYDAFQRYVHGEKDVELYSIKPHEDIPEEAELCDSKIVCDDGEFYAHLSIEQQVEVCELPHPTHSRLSPFAP